MKKLILALALALSVSTASAGGWSYTNCYAYTLCPSGITVWCNAWGNAATWTACTWEVVPFLGVQCTGFDGFGVWRSGFINCY